MELPMSMLSNVLRPEDPRLLLAHADLGFLVRAARILGRRGWSVHVAESAGEVRELVRQLTPEVVLLATRLPDESGWLTCDKLVRENPGTRVILLDTSPSEADRQFAEFVGAVGLMDEDDLGTLPPPEDLDWTLQTAG